MYSTKADFYQKLKWDPPIETTIHIAKMDNEILVNGERASMVFSGSQLRFEVPCSIFIVLDHHNPSVSIKEMYDSLHED